MLISRTRYGAAAIITCIAIAFAGILHCSADEEEKTVLDALGIKFVNGPATADLGDKAEVKLENGWAATDGDGARKILEATQNLTNGQELGMVEGKRWSVFFDFDPVGYVKDDEKNSLDAAKMMKSMQDNQEAANKEMKERGWAQLSLVGWAKEPCYNEQTHNLEWAIKVKSEDSPKETVNYNVKILGRKGVMVVTLLVDPDKLDATLPEFQKLISGFSYKFGEKYAEYVKGDKIAKYGLAALIVGGGAALAAKSGLLKGLWKIIAIGVIAIASVARKAFGAIGGLFKGKGDSRKDIH